MTEGAQSRMTPPVGFVNVGFVKYDTSRRFRPPSRNARADSARLMPSPNFTPDLSLSSCTKVSQMSPAPSRAALRRCELGPSSARSTVAVPLGATQNLLT